MSPTISNGSFRFPDLPVELQRVVCEHLHLDDLKQLSEASPDVYALVQEQIYAAATVRIRGRLSTHERDLKSLIKNKPGLPRLSDFRPSLFVKSIHLYFRRVKTSNKSSHIPGLSFDGSRVGYTGIRALPQILAHITKETFPKLKNLVIQVERTEDIWDVQNGVPYWYVIKPLLELNRIDNLRTIEIKTPETENLHDLRKQAVKYADCSLPSWQRDAAAIRMISAHDLLVPRNMNLRNGQVFELMSALLTYNLPLRYLKPPHEHSQKCFYGRTMPQDGWRAEYCPTNCILEEISIQIEGMCEELIGVFFGKVIGRLLHAALRDPWTDIRYKELSDLFDEAKATMATHGSRVLRKRKRVDYVELHTNNTRRKRSKSSAAGELARKSMLI